MDQLKNSRTFRRELARQSHLWFLLLYFPHYLTAPLAWFHYEMLELSEDEKICLAVIMAFRGSGKSTIMNLSLSLWSALGKQQKKFILIISRSYQQAKVHFDNIKREWRDNELLRNDFGNLQVVKDSAGRNCLILGDSGSIIMAVSVGQSIRGLRHNQHRPDLIICDDIEDSTSVEKIHERNRVYDWFMHEAVPGGDGQATVIVLGNLLHEESLLMRLKKMIEQRELAGVFHAYPLLDENDQCLWPEKFPTPESIAAIENTVAEIDVWNREYLLAVKPRIAFKMCREIVDKNYLDQREEKKAARKKAGRQVAAGGYNYCITAPIIDLGINIVGE